MCQSICVQSRYQVFADMPELINVRGLYVIGCFFGQVGWPELAIKRDTPQTNKRLVNVQMDGNQHVNQTVSALTENPIYEK